MAGAGPLSAAEAWLARHSTGAPAALEVRVRHYVSAAPADLPLPARLAAAGGAALAAVEELTGDRAAALDLLAADALVTLALLAQAEVAPERLAAFAEGLLPARRHP